MIAHNLSVRFGDAMESKVQPANNLVSVVIPSYLGEQTLLRALNSVVNDPGLFEIVIAVNGEDNTLNLLNNFKLENPHLRIKILGPESDVLSPGTNWTRACEAASGKYTKLLCADDTVINQSLFGQAILLENDPSIAFVTGKRLITDEQEKIVRRNHGAFFLSKPRGFRASLLLCTLFGTNIFGEPSAVTFRTDLLQKNLPWRDAYTYVIDLEMYLRILRNSPNMKVASLKYEVSTFEISKQAWSFKLIESQLGTIRRVLSENLKWNGQYVFLALQISTLTTRLACYLRKKQMMNLKN
jgi:glycosyltransferase involved in cell wall biosynthesis